MYNNDSSLQQLKSIIIKNRNQIFRADRQKYIRKNVCARIFRRMVSFKKDNGDSQEKIVGKIFTKIIKSYIKHHYKI